MEKKHSKKVINRLLNNDVLEKNYTGFSAFDEYGNTPDYFRLSLYELIHTDLSDRMHFLFGDDPVNLIRGRKVISKGEDAKLPRAYVRFDVLKDRVLFEYNWDGADEYDIKISLKKQIDLAGDLFEDYDLCYISYDDGEYMIHKTGIKESNYIFRYQTLREHNFRESFYDDKIKEINGLINTAGANNLNSCEYICSNSEIINEVGSSL